MIVRNLSHCRQEPANVLARCTVVVGLLLALAGCVGGPAANAAVVPPAAEPVVKAVPTADLPPTDTSQKSSGNAQSGNRRALHQPTAAASSEPAFRMIHEASPPAFYGAAPLPIEQRIYDSDIVVRAKLISVDGPILNPDDPRFVIPTYVRYRFKALEYLKGTGPDEIGVEILFAMERDDTWDDQEALLFLSRPQGQAAASLGSPAAAGADPPSQSFVFTYDDPHGPKEPEEYTVDSRYPVWLPATGGQQAESALGDGAARQPAAVARFAIDWDMETNRPSKTMTLQEVKELMAWMKGPGTAEYDNCVLYAMDQIKWHRDYEAYYGAPRQPRLAEHSMDSGVSEGSELIGYGEYLGAKHYHETSLTGEDAGLFLDIVVDDDNNPTNGYSRSIVTLRPLPTGKYVFSHHWRLAHYIPCNYQASARGDWTVTTTAPSGTLHEAFFDPVAIGQGVGANATTGVLQPAAISAEGYATTIKSLVWQNDSVTLTLSPYVSLLGQTLDFIARDGTVALSLKAKSATVDASAGTYAWSQATRPWSACDLLMLRLHGPTVSIADASGPEGKEVEFQVALSEAVAHEVRVSWQAEFHNTAKNYAVPNEYWHMSGELVFQPGETSRSAEVFLNDDAWREDDEVFLVILSDPKGATIADGEGIITIIDDD